MRNVQQSTCYPTNQHHFPETVVPSSPYRLQPPLMQRVLYPRLIAQVARQATPVSDDEMEESGQHQ